MRFEIGSVDHVITDPPYSDHVQGSGKLLCGTSGRACTEVAAGFDAIGDSLPLEYIVSLATVARRWAMFNCALEDLGTYRKALLDRWVRSGIYAKARAMPQLSGDRPGNRCEGISIFHAEGRKRWNGKGSSAYWFVNPENRKQTMHPTGKPLLLGMILVSLFTDPGETVLDPFCGTGTYGLACHLLGRHYLGIDNNQEHIANAHVRLANLDTKKAFARFEKWKETKTDADDVHT